MKKTSNIEKLALSKKKVFTTNDLAVIWEITERRRLIELIKYYMRQQRITHLRKGVYAYGTDYTSFEVAQKLQPMSYLSLYTTSQMHGLTFQYYETVYSLALKNRQYQVNSQNYIYHQIKARVFFNSNGLINNGSYTYADKERTVIDCLYVFPSFYFDNLNQINKQKLLALVKIYNNRRLEKAVNSLVKEIE